MTAVRSIPLLIGTAFLLMLTGCGAPRGPAIVQISLPPPHAMEFVHHAKTAYRLVASADQPVSVYVWWRTRTAEGVVDHPGLTVRSDESGGTFDVFVTECEALRFFRDPVRGRVEAAGRRQYFRLDLDEVLHAGTDKPRAGLSSQPSVLQRVRYFLRSNPLFADGARVLRPAATSEADVLAELCVRLVP